MNELIKNLAVTAAEQSATKTNEINLQVEFNGTTYEVPSTFIDELAHLVVQECLDAVDNTNKHHAYTTFDISMVQATIDNSCKSIKQRFGINSTVD